MAKDTIEAVKKAEESAIQTDITAKEKCLELTEQAAQESKQLIAAAEIQAQERRDIFLKGAQQEAKEIAKEAETEAQRAIAQLETQATGSMDAASDAVIALLTQV